MAKLSYLLVIITALELCSTHPVKNNTKFKYTSGGCSLGKSIPKFKLVALYDNITLRCSINSQSITFTKDCIPIAVQQNNTKFTISGNLLTLRRFVVHDGGRYMCKGIGPNGKVEESVWVLHILFKKTTEKPAEIKVETIYSDVMFDCRSSPNEGLFYSHSKTAHATKISSSRLVGDQNAGLYQLKNVKLDDTGFYYCGKSKMLMHLVVRDRPHVSGKSFVKAGEDVVLKCDFRGSEALAWYKGNKTMKGKRKANGTLMNNHYKKRHLNLTLLNITSNASGTYKCGVVVDGTTLTSAIRLDVFEFHKGIGVYGAFTKANATLFLQCSSNQGEKAKYSLLTRSLNALLSSEPFKEVKLGHGVSEIFPGLYEIDSLSPSQEGYYKCRASMKGITIEKELDKVIWISPSSS